MHPTLTPSRAYGIGQGATAVAGVGTLALALNAVGWLPACGFRAATGVPCPACGMTRLADALVHGDVISAVRADVAGVAILALFAAIVVVHVVNRLRNRRTPTWIARRSTFIALGALAAAHWVTTMITGGLTPV